MAEELLVVTGVVRTLAEDAFPDDPSRVDRAVSAAADAYLSGASLSEACRVGQVFIAGHHPDGAVPEAGELLELSVEECWQLAEARSVGRFAANRRGVGPLVVPVNYVIDEHRTIAFRSGAGAKLSTVGRGLSVIQVDEIDPLHQTGWSVMIEGTTRWLYEEQDPTAVEPWAPGSRPYVIRMTPVRVSGRRICPPASDTDARGYR